MFKQQLNQVLDGVKTSVQKEHAKTHIHFFVYHLSEGSTSLFEDVTTDGYVNKLIYSQTKNGVNYDSMSSLLSSLINFRFDDVEQGVNYMRDLLIEKNEKYGNAILEPMKHFSHGVSIEHTILSRMDEKLSRIINAGKDDNEDAWLDLIGYCIFYLINKN